VEEMRIVIIVVEDDRRWIEAILKLILKPIIYTP